MGYRERFLAAAALALGGTARAAAQTEGLPPGRVAELRRFEAALDAAVRQASQPAELPALGAAAGSRGYVVPGYGVVFVLPARSLSGALRGGGVGPGAPQPLEGLVRAEVARGLAAARDQAASGRGSARTRSAGEAERVRELQAIELEVEAYQREVERARQEAESALELMAREIQARLARAAAEAPSQPDPAPLFSPAPSAPPPPWRGWFEGPGEDEERAPERVVADVRAALTRVLESEGASLRTVAPEDSMVIAVDFAPRGASALRGDARARTLVVRARKRDLDDRSAGRLGPEELRKRIEYVEY